MPCGASLLILLVGNFYWLFESVRSVDAFGIVYLALLIVLSVFSLLYLSFLAYLLYRPTRGTRIHSFVFGDEAWPTEATELMEMLHADEDENDIRIFSRAYSGNSYD